jgi:hypothetical protein
MRIRTFDVLPPYASSAVSHENGALPRVARSRYEIHGVVS